MTTLPETGMSQAAISDALDAFAKDDIDWRDGRSPLYVFGTDPQAYEVGRDAFFRFYSENALGANRAFPSIKAMQDDVLKKCAALLNAPTPEGGVFTSGGTESIFLATRAARDEGRARKGIGKGGGNIVVPSTAHPAFRKAAESLDIEERRIAVDASGRADAARMQDAIDDDTVMLAGSAPCFPYGVIDPIAELGELAQRLDVWLHVDACVGGYLAPFVRDIGYPVPPFDMGVAGVASLSADLHKYGYCPKPASTLFFSTPERAERASFEFADWACGSFRTATLVGTRPAGAVAGAWAVLHYLGMQGYRAIASRVMAMRDQYITDIESIPGFRVFSNPELSIIAFTNQHADVFQIAALMQDRGWLPGLTQEPPALHIMLSLLHEESRNQYIKDLRQSTAKVEKNQAAGKNGARAQAQY